MGYISSKEITPIKLLINEEESLLALSKEHCDGWGISYYENGIPHLFKSEKAAYFDESYKHLINNIKTNNLLIHIRKVTQGKVSILNAHPFQHQNWSFNHNGNIKDFSDSKVELIRKFSPLEKILSVLQTVNISLNIF